jgi:hypothetical protein
MRSNGQAFKRGNKERGRAFQRSCPPRDGLTYSFPLVSASRLNPSMSLASLRLHSPWRAFLIRICVNLAIRGSLSALRVLRVFCGEIARLFRRRRRCNGREATARLSSIHASRVRSPDPCHPCNPRFETHSFPKSFAATLAALPSMSFLPIAPFSLCFPISVHSCQFVVSFPKAATCRRTPKRSARNP